MARIQNQTGINQAPVNQAKQAAKVVAVAGVQLQAVNRQAARPTNRSSTNRFKSSSSDKKKSAGKSKCEKGKKSGKNANPKAIAQINRLPDMQRNRRHHRFLRMLEMRLSSLEPLDQPAIKKLAEKCFEDTTQQFAGVRYAEEMLRDEGRNEEADDLAHFTRELERTDGEAIRSGLNISQTAESYVENGLGGYSELRKFYHETVHDYRDLVSTFVALRKELGSEDFEQGVGFLQDSMGADLSAAEPSIEPERLKNLMDDLYQVRFLNSFNEEMGMVINQMKHNYTLMDPCTSLELTEAVLNFVNQDFINPSDIQELPELVGAEDLEAEIYLQTQLLKSCRDIPIRLFVSTEPRDQLLNGFQMSLDELVAKEEELEDM